MTYVFAVVGTYCASLAVKQSIERSLPMRLDNEIFHDWKTGKLESLWTQARDFNYLKKRTEIRELDAIGLVAVKRNENECNLARR